MEGRKVGRWVGAAGALLLLLLLVGCQALAGDFAAPGPATGTFQPQTGPAAVVTQAVAVPATADPQRDRTATAQPTPTETPTAQATEAPPSVAVSATQTITDSVREVTLVAVGDMMLARSIGAALQRDPAASPFAAVRDALREADITVGNLETAVGTGGARARKAYTFLAPPAAVASLADAGFDVVTMANNHSLDYGPAALVQGLDLLDAAGIEHAGAGLDAQAAHRPAIVTRHGLRVAFLGYVNVPIEGTGFDTASWTAAAQRPGLAWAEPEIVAADVAAASRAADVVVVLLHSGTEGSSVPNAIQRAVAHAAIDAGALLVIGAHPHVLQGIERYKNGLIAYSLGNFVFDGFSGAGTESAILRLTLTPDAVHSVSWTPVVLRAGRPQVATGRSADTIAARIERLSGSMPPWPSSR